MSIRSTGIRPIERNGLRGFGLTITIEHTEQREVMDPVAVEASTDKQAAGLSRPAHSHSQAAPQAPADSAGEAPSSSPASPATYLEMPDIPAFLDRRQPKAREWEDA